MSLPLWYDWIDDLVVKREGWIKQRRVITFKDGLWIYRWKYLKQETVVALVELWLERRFGGKIVLGLHNSFEVRSQE